MNTWVLLERTPNLLPRVYQLVGAPQLSMLFDKTELASYADQSPILVPCDESSALLKAMRQTPKEWPGLILQSEQPGAVVLAHLRQILFVHFDGNRRGVLRYCNPVTASYFFPACEAHQLKSWLGPVAHLSWHGGTWGDRASNVSAWKTLDNPDAKSWKPSAKELVLGVEHERAFQCQQQDHYLYQWWLKQHDLCFVRCQQWLNEALRQGFTEVGSFERYLSVRRSFPQCDLPPALLEGSDETRLASLMQHLQKKSTGQEF